MDNVITVSQLNRYLKLKIDHDVKLANIYISGEISNFVNHKSGHFYFSLKDSDAAVRAIMFSQYASKLKFLPENGQKVILGGQISVYEKDGNYQLYVKEIIPQGVGDLSVAFAQLKTELEKEGLFAESHKRKLPQFPQKIGIITSPTGAALQDMLNIFTRRYPICDLFLYPAIVQGDNATKTLVAGIEYFNLSHQVDVILLGRGGGSTEDLWCFNDKQLAYAIYNSKIPIVSCVGHETDFTIADFVADLRAPTPSAAAELSVPDENSVIFRLSELLEGAQTALLNKIKASNAQLSALSTRPCLKNADFYFINRKQRLSDLMSRPCLNNPSLILEAKLNKFNSLKDKLNAAMEKKSTALTVALANISTKLDALSPLKVLSRGYSVVTRDGQAVSAEALSVNDQILIKTFDGELDAVVVGKREGKTLGK